MAEATCICQPKGWLITDKQQREFAFTLRQTLAKLSWPYAYQREQALTTLLHIVSNVDPTTAQTIDATLRETQTQPSAFPNVVRTVLRTVFASWGDTTAVHPLQQHSTQEKILAMKVLTGYCLLFPSASQAFAEGGVKAILQEFFDFGNDSTRHAEETSIQLLYSCIDALLAGSLKGPHTQQAFLDMNGPSLMIKVMPSSSTCPLRQAIFDGLAILHKIILQSGGQHSSAQRLSTLHDSVSKALGPTMTQQLWDQAKTVLVRLVEKEQAPSEATVPTSLPPQLYKRIHEMCGIKGDATA